MKKARNSKDQTWLSLRSGTGRRRLGVLLSIISISIMACQPLIKNAPSDPRASNRPRGLTDGSARSGLNISKTRYHDQLMGFWLGQSIANWTGLITEMDKIGRLGEFNTGDFYTRENWGQADQPSIWGEGKPSPISPTIDFVLRGEDEVWGADDDTDIEYMYLYLLFQHKTSSLSPEQIREGWLTHIRTEEENYLWVSNQRALELMLTGLTPPETSNPELNPYTEMIDAQLTTEIFGILCPGRPDEALELASLPIRTTARGNAALISEFYVRMHALAGIDTGTSSLRERLKWMSGEARKALPETTYMAKMYDFVSAQYAAGVPWEKTRDSLYVRYQVEEQDGYDITSQNLYCNGCFAAGINFGASLISLFYGEGDLRETIKIGALTGWDADNPTATWGGLIGFMMGKQEIEKLFNKKLSSRFDIHRTRQHFPKGIDTFENMATRGLQVIDRVVLEILGGEVDEKHNSWYIPLRAQPIDP